MEKILDRNIDLGPYVPQPDDDIIICRCEEVTKGEIRQAVHDGMWDLNEIRRYLRTGMGLCQGLRQAGAGHRGPGAGRASQRAGAEHRPYPRPAGGDVRLRK